MTLDKMDKVGILEEEALKRKERLKNLKRKLPYSGNDESSSQTTDTALVLPKPKFRSYKPQDETLQEAKMTDAEPGVVADEVKDLVEAGKEKVILQDLDISSLAPRKPDWDLKRDVSKKLEKLERRTQKAIAELIWERLKHGAEDNLSAFVTMSENRPSDDD